MIDVMTPYVDMQVRDTADCLTLLRRSPQSIHVRAINVRMCSTLAAISAVRPLVVYLEILVRTPPLQGWR